MNGFLDTNVLVRYLTNDPAHLAVLAEDLIENEPLLQVSSVILAETAHVLESFYGVSHQQAVDSLLFDPSEGEYSNLWSGQDPCDSRAPPLTPVRARIRY